MVGRMHYQIKCIKVLYMLSSICHVAYKQFFLNALGSLCIFHFQCLDLISHMKFVSVSIWCFQVDLLLSFCSEMGFSSVVLIGHDDGGLLALKAVQKVQASMNSYNVSKISWFFCTNLDVLDNKIVSLVISSILV